ncbi:MAG: hypothetical protein WCG51_00655 [Elusimicrobiota bacterium]
MNCRPLLLSCLLISILCVYVYYPALNAGFVDLDDGVMVSSNTEIMNMSWPTIKKWFCSYHYNMYHPLVSMSYAIEYKFFQADPFVYHVTNVFLHILNSMLVLVICMLLTELWGVSLLVAVLFAVHPMHVESVAWVTERKDVLYAFFFLWGMAAYSWYVRRSEKSGYVFALIFFMLSLLSKTMAVSFPAVLVLIDYHAGKRFDRNRLIGYVPFFIIAAIFSVATFTGQYSSSMRSAFTLYDFLVHCMSASYNVFFYLQKLVAPVYLVCIYPHTVPPGTAPSELVQYAPLALMLLAVVVGCFAWRNKKIVFGAGLFIVTILPVIGFVPVGISSVADRYSYIPFIGLFYVVAVMLNAAYRRLSHAVVRTSAIIGGGLICCVLAVMAHAQCRIWQSNMHLTSAVIARYPQVAFAYNGRGLAYKAMGEKEKAFDDFSTCIRLDPQYSPAGMNMGLYYFEEKNYDAAVAEYKRVSSFRPWLADPYSSLGMLYIATKDLAAADICFDKALRRDPHSIRSLTGKASISILRGNNNAALKTAQLMRSIAPYNNNVLRIVADVHSRMNDTSSAIAVFLEAIRIEPDDSVLYNLLGSEYGKAKQLMPALTALSTAIRLDPHSSSAWHNRGNIWGMLDHCDKALADYTVAVTLDKTYGEAYFKRAVVYSLQKKYPQARRDIARAQDAGYTVEPEFLRNLSDGEKGLLTHNR